MIAWLRERWAHFRHRRDLIAAARRLGQEKSELELQRLLLREREARLRDEIAANAFYQAWFAQLALPLPPAPGAIDKWTPADAGVLAHFLAQPAGRKFLALSRQLEAELHGAAVLGDKGGDARERACGFAAGFRGSFAYWLQLSVIQPPHPLEIAPSPETPGADEDAHA